MEFRFAHVPQYDSERELAGIADELVAQTELTREGGFDAVTVPEHHVTEDNYLLNEAVIGHLAEHVGDMNIATSMCLLPLHDPVRIAEFGATIDVLTEGQFRLGVAQGYREKEYEAFHVDRDDALGRFVEGVEVIKRLWTEDSVSYDGRHFQFEDISINPKPVQSPRPTILTGASNEKSVRRAVKLTDGWAASHVTFDELQPRVEAFRDEQTSSGDGDEEFELMRELFVAETEAEAERIAREPLMRKYGMYSDWGQDEVIENDEFDSVWEKLKHERFIVGTPDDVIEELARYKKAFDPDAFRIRTQWQGMEFEDVQNSIELFADEVIPSFR
jgi:alkanesulfonate monooxygenase SsuD/methylene tetrahydromethanopterin reductase-like flavin-dependent oxidoreductase (luciferase family)